MNEEQPIKKSIFDIESGDSVKSPEKLDEFIRVATPGTWLIVLAAAVALVALFVWGFTGSLPVHYMTHGVGATLGVDVKTADRTDVEAFVVKGLICFANATTVSSHQLQDKPVSVTFLDGTRVKGTSILLDTTPAKKEEAEAILKVYELDYDWVLSHVSPDAYSYVLYIVLEEELDYLYWGEVADVAIITRNEKPIHFLLGEGG